MLLINTETLKLEEFHGESPKYAILSHTWGDDEVTLQEFIEAGEETKRKQGYTKILTACRQARLEDISYCWVDTCCIDKTSSAELSEAINSMFNWYKHAKICFAYLSDFDLDVDVVQPVASRIAKCRWFTRGWCLQELIAPNELRFYDKNWRFVSDKKSMRVALSKITNIDQEVLEDSNRMLSRPIARRMSWASKRQTKRVEDIAYSLLGILDVNMPLLYGEGEKAFIRLQEEVIRKSNDLSIFAWSPPSRGGQSAYVDLLATSPALFEDCHSIEDGGLDDRTLSPSMFSLTNRGIQFTTNNLAVIEPQEGQERPYYVFPLYCEDTASAQCWMFLLLKKIGPGVYVRVRVSGDRRSEYGSHVRPWTIEKEIYILPKVMPDLYPIIETCHRSSFEIRTSQSKSSDFSIRGLEPCSAWDAPRSRFLTQGNPYFVGYVKIYPNLASRSLSEFFVITLSFRGQDPQPYVCLVHPDIWIMCDGPGRSIEWTVTVSNYRQQEVSKADGNNLHTLDLVQHHVTATIHTRILRNVPVHTIMLDWEPHGNGNRKRLRVL
ncbi:hypothetical protein NUW58_g9152 [Xylaria curta]|uniref:Uncharacterized protein n=1 Tax=Xylaria curta TaxID=42375 RepID=A0ACC1N0L1_9PEZI|nr:hypothetical protein NUW58_g9152 [Xylaria curta]